MASKQILEKIGDIGEQDGQALGIGSESAAVLISLCEGALY